VRTEILVVALARRDQAQTGQTCMQAQVLFLHCMHLMEVGNVTNLKRNTNTMRFQRNMEMEGKQECVVPLLLWDIKIAQHARSNVTRQVT